MTTHEKLGDISFGPCTTTIQWKIRNYFNVSQIVDYQLRSDTFSFLDAVWYLLLFPYGQSKHSTTDWISLYLVKKDSNSLAHHIRYTLSIKRLDGSLVSPCSLEYNFNENGIHYGWRKHLRVSKMNQQRKYILPEEVLTIMCTMRTKVCDGVQAAVQTKTSLTSMEKLVHDFNELLLSEEATDLTLIVRNREYKVHRTILMARSSVFSAMMKHEMKEKHSSVVYIEDCDPDAFMKFLTYLYSGNLEIISMYNVFELHNISDKYDVQELKASSGQFLMDNICVKTFCDTLVLALKHNESELLEKATEFFAKNLMNILVTTKWLTFVKENPVESDDLFMKATKYNENNK